MSTPAVAQIGHNSGSAVDLDTLLNPVMLTAQLELDHAETTQRRDDLLAGVVRFFDKIGMAGISSEEDGGRAADFAAQLKRTAKAVEDTHATVKAPFLAATRAVDAFFLHGVAKPLREAATRIEGAITAYQRRKALEEKARREDAARRAREEAEAASAAAARTMAPDVIDTAIAADAAAAAAERAATANATELSRSLGAHGGAASLRDNWVYDVVDKSQVPLEYLMVDDAKVRALIRLKNGVRDIPGLRIWNDAKSRVV